MAITLELTPAAEALLSDLAEQDGQDKKVCLTIPGLVIVKDLTTANLEDVIRWCHRQYYFETLQPCDCLSRQKPAATL